MRIEVYLHRSPNGKGYVGVSKHGMRYRWLQHIRDLKKGRDTPFHMAIKKYGPDAFTHELLDVCTTESGADRAEKLWIKELNTTTPNGYNRTHGGVGRSTFDLSPEERQKKGNAFRGRKHSTESRIKISVSRTGIRCKEEAKIKISKALKGMTHSDAARINMSKSQTGKKKSPEAIKKSADKRRSRTMSSSGVYNITVAHLKHRENQLTLPTFNFNPLIRAVNSSVTYK